MKANLKREEVVVDSATRKPRKSRSPKSSNTSARNLLTAGSSLTEGMPTFHRQELVLKWHFLSCSNKKIFYFRIWTDLTSINWLGLRALSIDVSSKSLLFGVIKQFNFSWFPNNKARDLFGLHCDYRFFVSHLLFFILSVTFWFPKISAASIAAVTCCRRRMTQYTGQEAMVVVTVQEIVSVYCSGVCCFLDLNGSFWSLLKILLCKRAKSFWKYLRSNFS